MARGRRPRFTDRSTVAAGRGSPTGRRRQQTDFPYVEISGRHSMNIVSTSATISEQIELNLGGRTPDISVIIGPTGIGKTDRAVNIARRDDAPATCIDRYQVFPELASGTGRPTSDELPGTERIYLAERKIADGELSARDAVSSLSEIVRDVSRRSDKLILEGGSTSLCTLLFESGVLDHPHVTVRFITAPDWSAYRQRVRNREVRLLEGNPEQAPMPAELAAVRRTPQQLNFVESIVG